MNTIAWWRKERQLVPIKASSPNFKSVRPSPLWDDKRVAVEIPLVFHPVSGVKFNWDRSLLPHLPEVMKDGKHIFLTAHKKQTPSPYSVLMYVPPSSLTGEENPPHGRTGILLFEGKPVIVSIDGHEYLLEVKGCGSPNRQNKNPPHMLRGSYFLFSSSYAGRSLEADAKQERDVDAVLQELPPSFLKNIPKIAGTIVYEDKYVSGSSTYLSQIFRLSPSSVRASFTGNDAFPPITSTDGEIAMRDVCYLLAHCAKGDNPLFFSALHPENILRVNRYAYTLTDFSDVYSLEELLTLLRREENLFAGYSLEGFLRTSFHLLTEFPSLTPSALLRGLNQFPMLLSYSWNPSEDEKEDTTMMVNSFVSALVQKYVSFCAYKILRHSSWKEEEMQIKSSLSTNLPSSEEIKFCASYVVRYLAFHLSIIHPIRSKVATESEAIATERIALVVSFLTQPNSDTADYIDSVFRALPLPHSSQLKIGDILQNPPEQFRKEVEELKESYHQYGPKVFIPLCRLPYMGE